MDDSRAADRWAWMLRLALAACALVMAGTALADEPVELRLGSDEWPPFTGGADAPRAALELVETALEHAGVRATTTITDWRQVEAAIRKGTLDGSAAIWRTPQREKNLLFSEPYLENRLVLVGRKGTDVSATRMRDLAGKRVAVVGQYAYGDEVDSAVGVYFIGTRNDQDSLNRLLAGDADYMLVDELVAHHLLTDQPEETATKLEIGMTPLARRPLYLAVRRDVPHAQEILTAFNDEIHTMQADGTYAAILQVGWVRVDVDGDGLFELVPLGERVGEVPPSSVYDVFGKAPDDVPLDRHRVVIRGDIYEGWDAIPDRYKMNPAGVNDVTFRQGTTLMTLQF